MNATRSRQKKTVFQVIIRLLIVILVREGEAGYESGSNLLIRGIFRGMGVLADPLPPLWGVFKPFIQNIFRRPLSFSCGYSYEEKILNTE